VSAYPARATTRVPSPHPLHSRPYYDHEAAPQGRGVIVRAGVVVRGVGTLEVALGRSGAARPTQSARKGTLEIALGRSGATRPTASQGETPLRATTGSLPPLQ
jgi:hypothetical protein